MTITLEVPQELEHELAIEAAKLGLSLSDYALRLLSRRDPMRTIPKTRTELVNYWQNAGLIGIRADIVDSQRHARAIRAQAEKRTKDNCSRFWSVQQTAATTTIFLTSSS